MIPGKVITPDDVLSALQRRWWLIAFPFVALAIGATYYAYSLSNSYKSETLILVVPQRIPENYVRSTVTSRIEDRLRSVSEQILSRSNLEQIIREFGLYVDLRQQRTMEEVVAHMRLQISAVPVRGDSFRVSYVSGDPVIAKKVTERLASMFIDENLRDREALAEGTNAFLEEQLENARRQLQDHEAKLEEYKRRYSGELPTQLQTNLSAIGGARQQLQTISESINRDRDRRLMLERSIADLSAPQGESAIKLDAADASPEQRLEAAREALRSALAKFKPDHPDVLAAQRMLDRYERELQGEAVPGTQRRPTTTEAVRRVRVKQLQAEIDVIDRQIASKEADAAKIRGQIDEYQRRADAAPTRETEMTELMRDYKTLQDLYTSLLAKKEDSKLAARLERAQAGEQFKILDPARVPESPFSPNRPQIIAFGSLIGLALGLGLALLLEFRDTSIRTEDEVVRLLALPVLALVPVVLTPADERRRRHRVALMSVATVIMVSLASAAVAWKLGIIG